MIEAAALMLNQKPLTLMIGRRRRARDADRAAAAAARG